MTLITNLSLVFHKTGYRPGKNRFYKHAPLIALFYQILGPYSYFCEEIATPGKLIALITNPMLDFTKNRFGKTGFCLDVHSLRRKHHPGVNQWR
jgi:hypothetical protein